MNILNFILIIFAIITYSFSRYFVFILKSASKGTPSFIQESMSSKLFLSTVVSIGLAVSIIINSIFFLDINALKIIPAIILIVLSINRLVEFIITYFSYNDKKKAKNEVLDFLSAIEGEFVKGEARRMSNAEKEVLIKNYHPNFFNILQEMKMLSSTLYTCALAFIFWIVLFFMVIHLL